MSARPILSIVPATMPQQLGKYRLTQVIGEGAMGVVYKGLDPHIGRPVAIKAIRAPLLAPDARDIAAEQRFRVEAQAAGRLSHPNIVSVYEYGESGPERFIAMEYVDGTSLLELLRRGGRLPLDDVLSVMLQLLDALSCAHAQGIWHRDIKPANLLVTPEGRLKVTDFGIARIDSADRTHHTTVLGSPGYMAPERYTDDTPDQRVDVFSCGVLLYELLAGAAPFRGSSGAAMYQVLYTDPPPPSTLGLTPPVPARFDAVVARALAKRAGDRYADAGEMREALCTAADRPIRATLSLSTMLRLRRRRDAADAPTEVLPRPAPVPTATVDDTVLRRLEAELTPVIGPITRLLVRNAAQRSPDLATLVQRLADEGDLDPDEREAFLKRARRHWPELRRAPSTGASRPLPVLGTTPMRPDLVGGAQRVLAEQVGPIAALLVRRAAAGAATLEQFFCALADTAGEDVDRKLLLSRLWRLR